MSKANYTIAKHNDQLVLVMNARTAGLVKSALEIINPDSQFDENLARNLAMDLENKL
jgi:hypothetical protein